MKVLLKRVGEAYEFVEVEKELSALQALIGGYLETVTLRGGLTLVCDEDGNMKRLPANSVVRGHKGTQIICGTFFVCKVDREGSGFAGFENILQDTATPNSIASTFSLHEFATK